MLLKNLYDCNFTLNLVKKNDVKLPQEYGNFTRSEFYGISASLVLSWTTSKISVYQISCKSIYFYYIAPLSAERERHAENVIHIVLTWVWLWV